jgi:tetratricopeptide (TPR) repeat protein
LALLYEVKRERLNARQELLLYRLMEMTGTLKQGQDFMAYSNAALSASLYAESQRVLEAGMKANAFPPGTEQDRVRRYIPSAANRAAATRSELPRMEAAARAAPNGEAYVALGMTQYSFGEYAKAIDALQAGIAKGGLKNPADASMALGIAQIKAGKKAEALKTFRAVKFNDEIGQRLAELWALYAS